MISAPRCDGRTCTFRSASPDQTLAAGRALGDVLRSGDVVALDGELGAGKTLLTRGIAIGLGIPAEQPIQSPTFVLIREYVGRVRLLHLDAYRLQGAEDMLSLGFDEMCAADDVVIVVEWAERVREALPEQTIDAVLSHAGESARDFEIGFVSAKQAERFATRAQREFERLPAG